MSPRTLVLGDIHGGYRALMQCFERSGFDNETDQLVFLGDAVDGWSEAPECVEELRRIKNLVYLLGNHDFWLMAWLAYGDKPPIWLRQGGQVTIDAYMDDRWLVKQPEHFEFLRNGNFYYHDRAGRLFVHGGIRPGIALTDQEDDTFVWDRRLFDRTGGVPDYAEVYLGHTPTIIAGSDKPINYGGDDNVWRLDTGAGWTGKLTIMDAGTKEYWQSDVVQDLYPGETGRM